MRASLLVFAALCLGGAVYVASESGVWDLATLALVLLGVVAVVAIRLVPSGDGKRRHSRANQTPAPSRAVREQMSALSASIEAIADARAGLPSMEGRIDATVFLIDAGRNQIAVIKAIRSHLKVGLKEAKELTDAAKRGVRPSLACQMPIDAARELARDIAAAGGRVEFE